MALPSPACRRQPSRPPPAFAVLQPDASLGKGNCRIAREQCSHSAGARLRAARHWPGLTGPAPASTAGSCPSGSVAGSDPGSSSGPHPVPAGRSPLKPFALAQLPESELLALLSPVMLAVVPPCLCTGLWP